MTDSPTPIEPVIIQLTRMEGKLDRVSDRVDDLRSHVARHDSEIGDLKSLAQSLKEGATASEKTALALALGLKDAKEATEATARNEALKAATVERENAAKAALGWSPITKLFAVATGGMVLLTLYQQVTPG